MFCHDFQEGPMNFGTLPRTKPQETMETLSSFTYRVELPVVQREMRHGLPDVFAGY